MIAEFDRVGTDPRLRLLVEIEPVAALKREPGGKIRWSDRLEQDQ
jgi:deazaflavin-dependent oxidoreductase (nitroreductase family)